ncbi:cytochrome c biogenesis CcdA family protein [Paenibacillus guangzhouensis]|uniref:cytochrome c biogenesis CcdA family protein n=1 Tax=Paenibacillus guangzhouensis TaxID=1473112 RepID=UPI0012668E35|nr:cytochrome c biogenesis protein CcdA [Paenibacillus guangzhouensis]
MSVWIAFWAGLASFISPCCLPLYPSYISFITGVSVNRLKTEQNTREVRMRVMSHTFFFVLGFSVVFYALSYGASLVGDLFVDYKDLIRQISAILILVMGLFLVGLFQPQFLMKERKFQFKFKPAGYIGSFVFGIGFSAGWSPCVGPILTAIIGLAATEPNAWLRLITAYTIGFAVPFFIFAFFIGSTRWILKYSNRLMKIGGVIMIIMAILLFTDQMSRITIWLQSITPEWLKF